MENRLLGRIHERRRKRMLIPAIYFIAEVIVAWLVFSLIQLNFDINSWNIWSLLIFILVVSYSTFKTIHVYRRQKSYPSVDENKVKN